MRRFVAVAFCIVAFAGPATPQAVKRPITVEDLWKVKRLGKPSISPDGKWVAVDVTTYSMDDNSSSTQIWLCSTDGKTQKQLTNHKESSTGPIWSPDGKSIAFTSKRNPPSPSGRGAGGEGETTQIYTIDPSGGEAKQVSKLPMTPSGLKWGGDSKTIYCVAWTWPDTPDDESYRKREKAKKDDKVQAFIIDDALYRVWDKWIADGKRPTVFAVDVGTGAHRDLLAGAKRSLPVSGGSAADYDVSPDGKEICFVSDSAKELGMDTNLDLYTMSLEERVYQAEAVLTETHTRKLDQKEVTYETRRKARGAYLDEVGKAHLGPGPGRTFAEGAVVTVHVNGEPKNITAENPGSDFAPAYSPDGKSIAFLRQTIKFFYADRARVMRYDRISGTSAELAPKLDRPCSSLQWYPQGLSVVYEIEDEGYHKIFSVNGKKPILGMLTRDYSDTAPTVARERKQLAFLRSNFDMPASLFTLTPSGDNQPGRIDHFNDSLRADWDLGKVDNVTYKGADDEDVQMWVVYPPKFDAKKKWPCLMMIHGGPHNAITTDFHYRWNAHLFASRGYVVAIPNFHGSSGFGQKFTDSITGDMATKPFIDVMKATDYMEALPFIDKTRTTAAGASYGGYMMCWINGHTDRYKALICHAGVYNWDSMMASDFVRGRERALGAFPWGDREKIDKQNPQRFAKNFKTPTLVMHGEKDYRVPISQGMEFYNTLRIKGVPTRFVYFPDENHWVLKPQNSRLWHREFFGWLEKYVGSGPTK